MLEFDSIEGACSTVHIVSIYENGGWQNGGDDWYDHEPVVEVSFLDFVKEMQDAAKDNHRETGFFISADANTQSLAISRFKKLGFKFTRPYKNLKNATTVQLGVANVDVVIAKCEALLKEKK